VTVEERIREALEKHSASHGFGRTLCYGCDWESDHQPAVTPIAQFAAHQAAMIAGIVREAQAQALRDAAADTRARGDIGKNSGIEAWDYLNWRADRIETGEP
jgi:hypothetical protein